MNTYETLIRELKAAPRTWLITGVAGFIGSNLLEALLKMGQLVIGIDNFSTGKRQNLDEVRAQAPARSWGRFRFIDGDLLYSTLCRRACEGVDFVLHQAALGSVPRSMADPFASHQSNVTGFLNILIAARDAKVRRLVYASSSSVYGDHSELPKTEANIGQPLSPYAATKLMNEIYAEVFARAYGLSSIGLRYFNVFGPRQDPDGPYAAVIPKWVAAMLSRERVYINGDGTTSRDFCFVENVVQANLLAATTANPAAINQVFNVGVGDRTKLNRLFELMQRSLRRRDPQLPQASPVYRAFRPGDVRHSMASVNKARQLLDYVPAHNIESGLELAMDWYFKEAKTRPRGPHPRLARALQEVEAELVPVLVPGAASNRGRRPALRSTRASLRRLARR